MANWYGTARTNYFMVKDAAAFKAWVDSLPSCVLIENDDGAFGFYVDSEDSGGFPSERYDEANDDYVDIDLADELVPHLADGEVAILMEAGAEKARYITGYALAVAWDGRNTSVDLCDIYDKAQTEFGVKPNEARY